MCLQLNKLSLLPHVTKLGLAHNPVCNLSLLRSYVIFRSCCGRAPRCRRHAQNGQAPCLPLPWRRPATQSLQCSMRTSLTLRRSVCRLPHLVVFNETGITPAERVEVFYNRRLAATKALINDALNCRHTHSSHHSQHCSPSICRRQSHCPIQTTFAQSIFLLSFCI